MSQSVAGNGSQVLPDTPRAGVCLHFSSLPGALGIGDIGDTAQRFIGQLASMRLSVWQVLPTGPTAYGDSPYQPLSAFAGNEMLLGLEPLVRDGLLLAGDCAVLEGFDPSRVDYGRVIPAKQALLARAAERFHAHASKELKSGYQAFREQRGAAWLDDYALYRILKTLHGERPWSEWAPEYARRDPVALAGIRQRHAQDLERIGIIQFLFDRQWQALRTAAGAAGVRLFGDIPIYIALDSADAWAHPEILLLDAHGQPTHVAGVPPDYFSEDGQLWGNPLYDWPFHARQGFRWWVERMRHAASLCDLVRVDHFRGFESYWSVPFGEATARQGQWEPGPGDALFEALEQALGRLPMVAEDLGVITEEVDALRERHHIPGMAVLQFDVADPEFDLADIEEHCVCYTGTHDNDTTLGWFIGGRDDTRTEAEIVATRKRVLQLTGGSAETVHEDLARLAFESRARLAVVPMQDFLGLGSEARMNTPGTTRDNWRWRMQPGALAGGRLERVRGLVEAAARG